MHAMRIVTGLLIAATAYGAVDLGDKAPPFDIAKWIVGKPVDPSRPDGKTVYVVEFWATWCPPCRESIPHLNEMHHGFKDKGVVIIGISGEDAATIKPFAKEFKMQYRVAADRDDATSTAYAGPDSGVPQAFVVDGKGIVVWSGHPMAGLGSVVGSVLAGTYSLERAKKAKTVGGELDAALERNDLNGALAAINKLISLQPMMRYHYDRKIHFLKYAKQVDEVVSLRRKMAKVFAPSPGDLVHIAKDILGEEDVRLRDMETALGCAKKAAELAPNSTGVLATLARAYADLGLCRPAMKALQKALRLEKDKAKRRMLQHMVAYVRQLRNCRDMEGGAAK